MKQSKTSNDIIIRPKRQAELDILHETLPSLIVEAGGQASRRFVEFFVANIRNPNTRAAYARAVWRFFEWCERCNVPLASIEPILVSVYIEELCRTHARPTVKQHLAAIRMLFDWLVVGHVVPTNPASAVRGPKYVVKKGKTPVMTPAEARALLDSLDTGTIAGLRDRALIGVMIYSFARVGAVVGMNVEDYYPQGKRFWLRLHEKGGKRHDVPAHHNVEAYLDAYIAAAGISHEKRTPLFRSLDRRRRLTDRRMHRCEVLSMIKRRARRVGLSPAISCHSFRATGITAFLDNGGTLENAQLIAAHESPRTTKLYDRTGDDITLDEIERVVI
jgi:integrase/recombinase XerD